MKHSPLALVVLIGLLLAGTLAAQSSTWNGSVDSRWDLAQNWTSGVPGSGVDAIIAPAPNLASTANVTGASCRGLLVQVGGVLEVVDGHPLKVHASSILQGNIIGEGDIIFKSSGTISATGGNSYPNVQIFGTYTLLDLVIRGDLIHQLQAGALSFDGLQTVEGNALFEGKTLLEAAADPGSVLEILGDGTSLTREDVIHPPLTINVLGDWTTNDRWLPLTGVVNFQGAGPQVITSPTVTTTSITLGSGSQITLQGTTTLTVQGSITVQGQLAAPPQTTISNDLVVPAASQLDVTELMTVAGSVINDGDISGLGTLTMNGTGMITGAGTFGNLEVDTADSIVIENTTGLVNGDFTMSDGSVTVAASNRFNVLGASTFDGGVLNGDAGSTLDLDGSASFAGTVAGASVPDISVAGDWTADQDFAPTMGSVILDGTEDSLISAAVEGGTLNFNDLQIVNGRRIAGTDLFLNVPTFTIAAGAAFSIGSAAADGILDDAGSSLGFGGGQMTIDGLLEIDRAELCLELGSVLTAGTGSTLRMTGTPNLPATICGPPCGNYEVNIGGRFEALNFAFLDMGPTGIRILETASIAAAPFDMRGGLFADGSPDPASVQLDVASTIELEFRDISFERQLLHMPEFNVRSTTFSTITFKNFSGNFAGPEFEDDPNDVIEWPPEMRTELATFNAQSAIGHIDVEITTIREVDLTSLRLFRMVDNSGVFVEMPGSPITPLGSMMTGADYSIVDFDVSFPSLYTYRIEEDLLRGGERVLGTNSATPREAVIGESLFVGIGGFADIGAAVAVAEKGSNIIVAAGTYPPFVLDRPVRIMSDGSGPFLVDTRGSKLVIRNIPAGESDIAIYDMQIIAPGGGPTGIEISNCDNVIILDNVQIDGASGVTALTIEKCRHVALQNCRLEGTDGLVVSDNSMVFILGGRVSTVSAILMSEVTHVATDIGMISSDPSSTITGLSGSSPRMEFPNLWPTSERVQIELSSDPGEMWCILQSETKGFFDLTILIPTEMILLLDPFQPLSLLRCGNMPASGRTSGALPIADDPSLWGMNTALQMFVMRPPFLRMGNVRDAVFLPPGN